VGANGARRHLDVDRLLGEDDVVLGEDGRARQLRLEAALGNDVDAARQLELVGLGVEVALRGLEIGFGLLGVDEIAIDAVEADVLGVDESCTAVFAVTT
ncbi:hypothetical protein MXD81_14930, partial [Microbacteriaceae bacterium K1510]|nr:hypothetical protein [Microbacteriaceae bacterium K1510]